MVQCEGTFAGYSDVDFFPWIPAKIYWKHLANLRVAMPELFGPAQTGFLNVNAAERGASIVNGSWKKLLRDAAVEATRERSREKRGLPYCATFDVAYSLIAAYQPSMSSCIVWW